MEPHRIFLRGPWEWQPPGDACRRRIHLPAASLLESGTMPLSVRLSRRFYWPKPLPAGECLWLVVKEASGEISVWLNQHLLGAGRGSMEFDITDRVRQRNLLEIEAVVTPQAPPWREVALEVRELSATRPSRF